MDSSTYARKSLSVFASSEKGSINTTGWFFLLVFLWVLLIHPGKIEGKFFPVATPMQLDSVRYIPGKPNLTFNGRSERLRIGCNFVRIDWRLGVRGGQSVPLHVTFPKNVIRPNGPFSFSGWVIDVVPPSQFLKNTYADVVHQCRILYRVIERPDGSAEAIGGLNLPWHTYTPFWG